MSRAPSSRRICGAVAASFGALFAPCAAAAQVQVRSAVLMETYDLSEPYGGVLDAVDELSIPVTLSATLADRFSVTLATGYARVVTTLAGARTTEIAGGLDTEARLGIELVPDRLVAFATSAFPTGIGSVPSDDVSALAVLGSEVIGFSAPNLGGGGSAGGGLAFTLPAGAMAVGAAVGYEASGTLAQLTAEPGAPPEAEFRPGPELRLRVGLEGAVGRRTFLRLSGILSRRGEDEANGVPMPSVGNRYTGYLAVDQGVGWGTLTLYAFDLFRAARGVEETPVGASLLDRGNVFAAGAHLAIPITPDVAVIPRFELRDSRAEADAAVGMVRQGRTSRLGADVRTRLTKTLSLVLRADALRGSLRAASSGGEIDVSGSRLAAHIEIGR